MEYYTFVDYENMEAGLVIRDPGVQLIYLRWETPGDDSGLRLGDFDRIAISRKDQDEWDTFQDMEDEIEGGTTEYGAFRKLDSKNKFFKIIFEKTWQDSTAG